jgi:hypothetical protein
MSIEYLLLGKESNRNRTNLNADRIPTETDVIPDGPFFLGRQGRQDRSHREKFYEDFYGEPVQNPCAAGTQMPP